MRKIAIILLACLLTVCLFSACGDPEGTTAAQNPADSTPALSTAADPNRPKPLPAEGVLAYRQEGKGINVSVTLPACAGEEVSLLLLKDLRYQYSWAENPDACLSDLGQLKLSQTGEGDLTLTPKDAASPLYLVLTASSGSYSMEVILK